MNALLLVVTIGGQRVALPSEAVESVVELDTLIPVPRAAPHVAGLSALRSRVLTVIDCMRSLELGATDCSDGIREAAVVELDGHHYALIVDLVEDVVEALSEPAPIRAAKLRGAGAAIGEVTDNREPMRLQSSTNFRPVCLVVPVDGNFVDAISAAACNTCPGC